MFANQIIQGISKNILDLSSLRITMSSLLHIPKILRRVPSIYKISISNNFIQDTGLSSLIDIVLSSRQIKSLDIGRIGASDSSLMNLLRLIQDSNLTRLQFGCRGSDRKFVPPNQFSESKFSQILELLTNLNRYECLGFSGVIDNQRRKKSYSSPISHYIRNLIKKSNVLRTLDISDLGFRDEDQNILFDGFYNNKTLWHLDISCNTFPNSPKISDGISQITSLKYLQFSSCSLTTDTLAPLSLRLGLNWGLIVLDLSGNDIDSNGISNLFNELQKNIFLISLNISNNKFDSSISNSLRDFFHRNNVLQILDMSKNHLNDEIAEVFSDVLSCNESLLKLSLASCRITDKGANEIANSIVNNKTLQSINLNDNFISNEAGIELLQILQKNETITYIGISSNQINNFVIAAFKKLCERNKMCISNQRDFPLRKEFIRLSIQKSKIPFFKERLKEVNNNLDELNDDYFRLNNDFDNYLQSTNSKLENSNREIKEYEKLINEEIDEIEKLKNEMKKMKEENDTQINTRKNKIKEEEMEFNRIVEKANEIEKQTNDFINERKLQQEKIENEIKETEELIKEIQAVMKSKNALKKYQLPNVLENGDIEMPVKKTPQTLSKNSSTKSHKSSNLVASSRSKFIKKKKVVPVISIPK